MKGLLKEGVPSFLFNINLTSIYRLFILDKKIILYIL